MGKGSWSDYEVNPAVKYCLFIFNLLLWLISIVFVAIGAWAYIEKDKFDTGSVNTQGMDIYDIVFDLSIIVIIIGACMFIITFAGCIGALRENERLLVIFCVLVGIVFLAEVVIAILAFIFSTEIETKASEVLQEEGIPRYRLGDLDWDNFVNWVQETFDCCGIGPLGYLDWSSNPYFNCTEDNPSPSKCGVPYSCCIVQTNIEADLINTMCGYGTQELSIPQASTEIFTTGCIQSIKDLASANLYILGGVALGLAVPQLICIFLGWCLLTQVKNTRPN